MKNREITFKELKGMVGKAGKKLPSAKKLMEQLDEGEDKILLSASENGAEISVCESGCILYTRDKRSTVYAVSRCTHIWNEIAELDEGFKEDYRAQGLETKTTMVGGKEKNYLCIPEKQYEDLPWFIPICCICEERLAHNQESREEYYSEFAIDGDGNDWNNALSVPDYLTEMSQVEEEKEAEEKKKRDLERLREVLQMLTPRQREIVQFIFANPGMKEREVAEHFGITQQAVNKIFKTGMKNLVKNF